jgi:hypothetical protein
MVAYRRQGRRLARVACVPMTIVTLPCRTKPRPFGLLYPPHLGGLLGFQPGKKRSNFLLPTGFDLV